MSMSTTKRTSGGGGGGGGAPAASRSGSVRKAGVARGEYIETDSGNKVSRRAQILGAGSIQLIGKAVIQNGVVLRGDLHRQQQQQQQQHSSTSSAQSSAGTGTGAGAEKNEGQQQQKRSVSGSGSSGTAGAAAASTAINIGRYTVISQGCVIKPPGRMSRGMMTYYPLRIGDNVFIGPNAHISAAQIANNVHIGAHAVLHPFSIVKDHVKILPHTVVPAGMVVASGSIVAGRPGRVIGEVPDGWGVSRGGIAGGAGGTQEAEWVEGGELMELVRSIR